MIHIRGIDGRTREENDGYILMDGEAMVVPMTMMDSRRMVTDSRGLPAGTRPGFLFVDDAEADRAKAAAYAEYESDIKERWRGPTSPQVVDRAPPAPLTTDAAYAQYTADLTSRWRAR
jgi:hypothetical protein